MNQPHTPLRDIHHNTNRDIYVTNHNNMYASVKTAHCLQLYMCVCTQYDVEYTLIKQSLQN